MYFKKGGYQGWKYTYGYFRHVITTLDEQETRKGAELCNINFILTERQPVQKVRLLRHHGYQTSLNKERACRGIVN